MKKLMAIALLASLATVSCSKKDTNVESNTMLEEPNVEVVDSASATKSIENTAPATVDSTMMKKDSEK
jgi:uncharacterized protein YcfL